MHRLLTRQIKKELGEEFLNDAKFKSFFELISSYYDEKEKERVLLENALEVNSKELTDLNKQLQEHSETLLKIQESALDAAVNMVMITDKSGQIIYANKSFYDITGYDKEEVLGFYPNKFSSHIHTEDFYKGIWSSILAGKHWSGEIVNSKKDGTLYPEEMTITPIIQNGKITHFVAIKRDITERKLVEEELTQARDKAFEASRLKSEFLATMSHEIRTPMNGVIGMVDILSDTELSPLQREFLNTIKESSNLLITIINDILDFSKIEAGKLDIEYAEVNVPSIVENVCELLSFRAKEKHNALISYVDPKIDKILKSDPTRITQILVNLVGNAIKFTKEGEISVKVYPIMRHAGFWMLRFDISDTGIGISEENQQKLFQSFTQADSSTTRKYGGTGLGLAICKRLIDLMKGRIWITSELGSGATFSFVLPFEELKDKVISVSNIDSSQFENLRVLVVDDSQSAREILFKYLKYWAMECVTAEDSLSALKILKEHKAQNKPIDVAIIDLMMPDIDGLELSRMINKDSDIRDTKMILCTAYDQKGTALDAKNNGFVGYITKPIRHNGLLEALYNALNSMQGLSAIEDETVILAKEKVPANIKGSILLAEDNKTNQKVATLLLNKMGYSVAIAENGQSAVDMLNENSYDLILMDCNMPVMDGFEATACIRNFDDKKKRNIQIIALTANAMQEDVKKCLGAGMNDFISKPINQKELEQKVHQAISAQIGAN